MSALDLRQPSFLTIEDFGTTGLIGSYETRDDQNFNDFWRRVGRSHKASNKGGSWGLGKLVFPVSSDIRTFFGLTVRHDDPGRSLLMGQAILAGHKIDGVDHAEHSLGLRQVEPAGEKCPQRELARSGTPSAGKADGIQHGLQEQRRAERVQLGHRLARVTALARPKK